MSSLIAPFQIVGGRVASTSDVNRIIEQKIINVLTTAKLERIGLPEYGAGVQHLLFEDIDELVMVDFKTDAATELADSISGLQLVDIGITQKDDTTADITVIYRTPLSPARSTTFSVSLPGPLTEESPL